MSVEHVWRGADFSLSFTEIGIVDYGMNAHGKAQSRL